MKLVHNYYVYIIQCNDGFYYTGVTNDVDKRVRQHNEGLDPNCYSCKRRPFFLKYYEHFGNVKNAIAYEKQLKGWSRKKKEALFVGDYETIKKLAKSKNNPSASSG
jgi:putative endonuclease